MTGKLVQNAFIVQYVHRLTNGICLNNKERKLMLCPGSIL